MIKQKALTPQTFTPLQQQILQVLGVDPSKGIDLSKLDWKQLYEIVRLLFDLWKTVQSAPAVATVAQAVKNHGGNAGLADALHEALGLNLMSAEVLAAAIASEAGW